MSPTKNNGIRKKCLFSTIYYEFKKCEGIFVGYTDSVIFCHSCRHRASSLRAEGRYGNPHPLNYWEKRKNQVKNQVPDKAKLFSPHELQNMTPTKLGKLGKLGLNFIISNPNFKI